jgi:hypothetical protein
MTKECYNVFNSIHKGLRNLLYSTAIQIQQTDFSSDQAAATNQAIKLVVALFDEHAQHEDTYLLPLIEKYDSALIAQFEKDHRYLNFQSVRERYRSDFYKI